MSAPPARCCAPATKGRCSNAPAPYGQSRYIGCVEIAACNHPKHQAALRSLPDFQRRAGVCGADDCGKAAESGLCPEHRQLYRRHGVNIRALLAQEAPMTEPTPEAQTTPVTPYDMLDAAAKVWFAMPQEERDACLVAISVATISTGESAPMPPAAPQDAAGGVTTQSGGYLACITPGCGDEDLMDLDQTTGLCGMCSRQQVRESKERDYEDNYVPVSEPVPAEARLPPIFQPLEARRDRLVATLLGAGFEEKPAISGRVRRFAYCNDYWVIVPNGPAAESQEDFARALDTAEAALKRLTSTVDAPHLPVVPAPADDGEPSAADVDDAPLFVGGTDSAPMQQRREAVVARLLALGAEEQPGRHPTARVFALKYEAYIVPDVSYSAKDMEAAMQSVERACDRLESFMAGRWSQKHTALPMSTPTLPPEPTDLAALAARGQQPTAPGPTVADLQQQLAATRDALTRIASQLASVGLWAEVAQSPAPEVDGVGLLTTRYLVERERADAAQHQLREAVAELAVIAALLDPEDAPAFDAEDQPIPLPVRVQTALMPHSESVLVRGLRAERDAFWGIINDTEWIVHHCGSYGATASLADRVLRLLPVERQRAILELKRSEAYIDVARINARFLNPPPPGRLEECVAKVAAIEAKIAALPSLPPSTTPLAMEVR